MTLCCILFERRRYCKLGKLEIDCLYPLEGVKFIGDDDNHGSLVLKYEYGGTKVLLTGDAAVEDERVMLSKGTDVSAEIIKLGHHGSKNASSRGFFSSGFT